MRKSHQSCQSHQSRQSSQSHQVLSSLEYTNIRVICVEKKPIQTRRISPCIYSTAFKNQRSRQHWCWSVKCTFLESSWYTEAKKIPEKLIYRRHLACFFQNKISQKIFFGLNSSGRFKNWLQPKKNFFEKWPEKHLEKFRIKKELWIFSKCFWKFSEKNFFAYN